MLYEFKSQLDPSADDGSLVARLVPFGVKVPYGKGTVQFAAGGIDYPETVPLTIDHAEGVLARIGVMTRHFETDDGAYAEFQLAATPDGDAVRELLKLGAVTDVSVGIAYDGEYSKDITMSGVLDHVSVVDHGRFSTQNVGNPAQVLSVHDKESEPVMAETEEATAQVVEFDDSEIKGTLVELSERVEEVAASVPADTTDRLSEFSSSEILTGLWMHRQGKEISNHALADVIGDLGSADASGIVPDYYWAGGLQHNLDSRRPLFATAGSAPFPSSGNLINVPRITQGTAVAERTAQKAAVASQALQAEMFPFDIIWYGGAVDVAFELISQADPSALATIYQDLLKQYAVAVESGSTGRLTAVGAATGAALDTSTYAALVGDLITTSDLIEDAVGSPGNICGVTPAQWIAILSLMDGVDRRQFAMTNGQNQDGSGSLVTRGIDIGGIFVYRAPAATAAVQYNQDSYKTAEKSPMQVAVDNVELMGRDLGLLAATVDVFWPSGVYTYEV